MRIFSVTFPLVTASFPTMQREFSEAEPELMDLPNLNERELQADLENLATLNRTFGATYAVDKTYRRLSEGLPRLTLVDLGSGYGDHGRHLMAGSRAEGRALTLLAVDQQFQTLRLARQATPADQPIYYIQADARQLPFREKSADLVFCTLALHHFADHDAQTVLREMARIGRHGLACIDLTRSWLASISIWLLTVFFFRKETDKMTVHDARLSARRAFSLKEMKSMARLAGWPNLRQVTYPWFRQAVLSREKQS